MILFILNVAFLEEATFRELILHGAVRVWCNSSPTILQSNLISSRLFDSMPPLYIFSRRLLSAFLLQTWQAFIQDVLLAALMSSGKCVYLAAGNVSK